RFGAEYDEYAARVSCWIPTFSQSDEDYDDEDRDENEDEAAVAEGRADDANADGARAKRDNS
ncbi:MAG: isoprenylcysteine carboxylmethyltransferase family protein, partial [Brevibacterium aurantiacum]|nr:isoprenylcysteine carboxylmethyltransferase family protein [Brevibacterium aurantiacum]